MEKKKQGALDDDILSGVTGGLNMVGQQTTLYCPECGYEQPGNHGTHLKCPKCEKSYLVPQK